MTAKKSKNDGININSSTSDSIRPTKAPKSPPLLHSEKTEFLRKIRQLQEDAEVTQTATLQKVTRIINEADYIDEEIKTKILKEIWK